MSIGMDEAQLSEEQKAELAEAVQAEKEFLAVDGKFNACISTVSGLHKQIIDLLGRGQQGGEAYARNLAIQRLEEVLHRIHDGVACIKMRGVAEAEALKNAQDNGTVLKMPGVK
jgi:hypothetical protein